MFQTAFTTYPVLPRPITRNNTSTHNAQIFMSGPSRGNRRPNRRYNSGNSKRQPQYPQNSSDLFQFFADNEDIDDVNDFQNKSSDQKSDTIPAALAREHSEDQLDLSDDDQDESDENELLADDNVDDGFFSRYRREANTVQRTTYSSFNSNSGSDSDNKRKAREPSNQKNNRQGRKITRETANNAFHAMDKLFGSINAGRVSPQSRSGQAMFRSPSLEDKQSSSTTTRDGYLNKNSWLEDVRARAATTDNEKKVDEKENDNASALDVEAVEYDYERSEDKSVEGNEPQQLDSNDGSNDDFAEAKVDGEAENQQSVARASGYQDQRSKGKQQQQPRSNISNNNKKRRSKGFRSKEKFETLMTIARQGPQSASHNNVNRNSSQSLKGSKSSTTSKQDDGSASDRSFDRGSRVSQGEDLPDQKKPDVSHLLGITKKIISNQRTRNQDEEEEEEYESTDDETAQTIQVNGKSNGRNQPFSSGPRQQYIAVRRIGTQKRNIVLPPPEWSPLEEEDVAKIRSDSRPLGGNRAKSLTTRKASECFDCRGTGMETCSACLGEGWIPPLSERMLKDPRTTLLKEIWNTPNLVVNSLGEAQCLVCNGVGKQFCTECKGSGSNLRKGFNPNDVYKVFDMFPQVDDDSFADGKDNEDEDYDEDEDDEFESFKLYRGKPESFDFTKKPSPRSKDDDDEESEDIDDVDDVIEVEDESEELLATLEAMHLADLQEGRGRFSNEDFRSRAAMNGEDDEDDDDDDDDFNLELDAEGNGDDDDDLSDSDELTANLDDDLDEDDLDDDLEDDELSNEFDDDLDLVNNKISAETGISNPHSIRPESEDELYDSLHDDVE